MWYFQMYGQEICLYSQTTDKSMIIKAFLLYAPNHNTKNPAPLLPQTVEFSKLGYKIPRYATQLLSENTHGCSGPGRYA
jgi:hypothetical protein